MTTNEQLNQLQERLDIYLETGNETVLKEAINLSYRLFQEGNDDAGYSLAKCYTVAALNSLEYGSIELAIAVYKKLINNHYENNYIFIRLGQLYENIDRLEDAFECYKHYYNLEPNDEEGAFFLAKCYKNGIGTEPCTDIAKNIFASIEHTKFAKNNEFFADEYGQLLEECGLYKNAHKWFETAFSLTDDAWAKAYYAQEIISLHLKHNPFGCSSASSIIQLVQSYIDTIEEIDRNSQDLSNYSDIHETYLIVKNEINIFLAKNENSQAIKNTSNNKIVEQLTSARNAIYNKNYSVAIQLYRSIISVEPQNAEAIILCGLLENDESTIDNYSQKLSNIKRVTAENNIRSLKNFSSVSDTKMICKMIALTTINCVSAIHTVLTDTFDMLVATRSTFQRLSPVGFSNNIYNPTLYEIGQLLYDLGDTFERTFGSNAHEASADLWKMGNAYMNAYMDSQGFFKKMEIKGKIREYTSKIK